MSQTDPTRQIAKILHEHTQKADSKDTNGRVRVGTVTSTAPMLIQPMGTRIPLPSNAMMWSNSALQTRDNWQIGDSVVLAFVNDLYVVVDLLDTGEVLGGGGGSSVAALDDLTDVTSAGANTSDVLMKSVGDWVAAKLTDLNFNALNIDGVAGTPSLRTLGVGSQQAAAGDHTHAQYAPLASPTFTGTPLAPTPATADNTTKIATTAYVQANLGSYLTTATAASTYAPLASPALTGTPTAPTAVAGTNTTQLATTAFVTSAISTAVVPATVAPLMDGVAAVGTGTKYAREDHVHPTDTTRAPVASPTFTGTPAAPTPATADNTTKIATTAYVQANLSSYLTTATAASTYAPLASPALTGTPTAPTATGGTNTTQIATTAFVQAALGSYLTTATAASTYMPLAGGSFTGNVTQSGTTTLQIGSSANLKVSGRLVLDETTYSATGNITVLTPRQAYTGTGGHTLTLPALAAGTTADMFFENRGSGNVTISRGSTDTITLNGTTALTSVTVAPGEALVIYSSGATPWLMDWAGGRQPSLNAPLASPALTGTPTAPTAATATNTTQIATTAYVQANLASYLTTATAASTYAPLASPAFTGTPTAPTAATATNTTQIATTAYVQANLASYLTTATAASTYLPLTGGTLSGNLTVSKTGTALLTNKSTSGAAQTITDAFTGFGSQYDLYVNGAQKFSMQGTATQFLLWDNIASVNPLIYTSSSKQLDLSANTTVLAPTPSTADNSTKVATTAYVQSNLTSYLTTSSAAATYLTIANASATYLPLTGGTLSNNLTITKSGSNTILTVASTGTAGSAASALLRLESSGAASTVQFNDAAGVVRGAITKSFGVPGLTFTDGTNTALAFDSTSGALALGSASYTVTAPTVTTSDNSTKVATTAYVQANLASYLTTASAASTYLPLAGGTMTGNLTVQKATPLVTVKATGATDAEVKIDTSAGTQKALLTYAASGTSFMQVQVTNTTYTLRDLVSPNSVYVYTGSTKQLDFSANTTVLAPTPTAGDNSTKIATTAFVQTAITASAVPHWKGTWSAATAYVINDMVYYAGSTYIATAAGTNHQPDTSPTFWDLMASRPSGSNAFGTPVGDGTNTSFTVTHGLGTRDVIVSVRRNSAPYDEVWAGHTATADDSNHVTVTFDIVPTANQFRVIVQSGGGAAGAAGHDAGHKFTYSSTTTAADPGSGNVRLNNTNLSLATAMYISETDAETNAVAAEIATWDDSTATVKGKLFVRDSSSNTQAIFQVTGTVTDNGTWDTITLSYLAGATSFVNGDALQILFVPTGDTGATGGAATQDIGDGVTTVFNIAHSLGTANVFVMVREKTTGIPQWAGLTAVATSASNVRVTFDSPPTTNQYTVTIMSGAGPQGPTGLQGPAGNDGVASRDYIQNEIESAISDHDHDRRYYFKPRTNLFRAYRAAAFSLAAGPSWQTVPVDTLLDDIYDEDQLAQSNIGANAAIIRTSGYYQFNGMVGVPSMGGVLSGIALNIGGVQRFTHHEDNTANGYLNTGGLWYCAAGTAVFLQVYNGAAATKALDVARPDMNMFSFFLVHKL